MTLNFECILPNGTCGLYSPCINEAKFRLASGSEIIIDRDKSSFTMENNNLSMTWFGCYLWAIDDKFIFDTQNTYLNSDSIELLKNAKLIELAIEDFVDEEYKVEVVSWSAL